MNLKQWFKKNPTESKAGMARAIGVHAQTIHNLVNRSTSLLAYHALLIEEYTKREVTLAELLPPSQEKKYREVLAKKEGGGL